MKKIFLLFIAFAISIIVKAEDDNKFKFNPEPSEKRPIGLTIGYVQKSYKYGNNIKEHAWANASDLFGGDIEAKRQNSMQIGISIDPEFKYGIGISTGIFYELTPSISDFDPDISDDYRISIMDHELSIPLRLSYRYEIVKNLSLFLYTGPSFDVGLAMTIKEMDEEGDWVKIETYSGVSSDSYGHYEKEDEDKLFKRFHLMWGVGGGLQYKGLRLSLQGDWGLNNINARTKAAKEAIKLSKPFAINLSWMF